MIRQRQKSAKQTPESKTPACAFCKNKQQMIDYKDVQMLQRYTSSFMRILPGKKTGVCAKHQRTVTEAVKRARIMALMPFVKE